MISKCTICNNNVSSLKQKLEAENIIALIIVSCVILNFSHDPNEGLAENQLDNSRLASAGLVIPEVEEDFQNGLLQSKEYFEKYIDNADIDKNI